MRYRFFLDAPLEEGCRLSLPKDEQHHLKRVMRVKPDQEIEVVNGKGYLAIGKYNEEFLIESISYSPPSQYKRILIQAYPEQKHLEFIVEKGTELGITDFWLFPSKKSPFKTISDGRKLRCHNITISAIKQCKRLYLPKITYLDKLNQFPKKLYLADPSGSKEIIQEIEADRGILVGPESGFTKEEIDFFIKEKNAIPLSLSENVLRCETAAIIASSIIAK